VFRLKRFDIARHASFAMPAFQKAVLKAGGGAWPLVSPDGKWAVCWVVVLRPRRTEWLCAVSLDGSRIVRWPAVRDGVRDYLGHGWMPDGRTYIVLFVNKVLLYRVQTPGKVQRLWIPKLFPGGSAGMTKRLAGTLPDGFLVTEWHRSGQSFIIT